MTDLFAAMHAELIEWRRDLHRYPELGFQEERTSALVAERLSSFGIEVHRGLARTGVVGTLRAGRSDRAIALRADMDALPIQERTNLPYRSTREGVMHACGHDGHTTMLLGAARYLAATRNFDGVVHFIFQPAEENEGGGRVMIAEGLFERFPVERVYGLHNFPGLPEGAFAMRVGPLFAAFDKFEIIVRGRGAHAALPHLGLDPLPVAAQIVGALQTLVSRRVDPIESAVVSVTQIHGGDTWNVIPEEVTIRGCTRSFVPEVQDLLETSMATMSRRICEAHEAEAEFTYTRGYPPTVNTAAEVEIAAAVAERLVGAAKVDRDVRPTMGSEDFAFMLQHKPGCYVLLGAGPGPMCHHPRYDFNDAILPVGARYWAALAETELASQQDATQAAAS
ncbi:MAG TPA: M20 aminoacylase family protein [Thermoanaerobaculia bacterium]|nr:M20 aminoacylase family protein [Thermoanaerobaculia bacterium]